MFDCIIVGGGPAGLQAALILGRSMRKVLVFDDGRQRNLAAAALHGYLTRDDISPHRFLEIAHQELLKYEDVLLQNKEVTSACRTEDSFKVMTQDGSVFHSKSILLATGVLDSLPEISGLEDFYGKSIFTCPYCDAWEMRWKALAVYGKGKRAIDLAKSLKLWSHDLWICTDGTPLNADEIDSLNDRGIKVKNEKIKNLIGKKGQLEEIVFEDGFHLRREGMFVNSPSFIRSKLLDQLGCPYSEKKGAVVYKYEQTEIPGLFVAGNILRDVQLVIVAAADGAQAAFGINKYLLKIAPP